VGTLEGRAAALARGRKGTESLAQLIAFADTDKAARLRLLRALRDLRYKRRKACIAASSGAGCA
jgi:hypothetical protein